MMAGGWMPRVEALATKPPGRIDDAPLRALPPLRVEDSIADATKTFTAALVIEVAHRTGSAWDDASADLL
jgi:hypothetical protein